MVLVKKFGYPGESTVSSVDRQGHQIKEPPMGFVHWILADKAGY